MRVPSVSLVHGRPAPLRRHGRLGRAQRMSPRSDVAHPSQACQRNTLVSSPRLCLRKRGPQLGVNSASSGHCQIVPPAKCMPEGSASSLDTGRCFAIWTALCAYAPLLVVCRHGRRRYPFTGAIGSCVTTERQLRLKSAMNLRLLRHSAFQGLTPSSASTWAEMPAWCCRV